MKRKCILVLGMHRSGTSAITRVINCLGADISPMLIPAKPSNETGFWESQSVFHIHNDLIEGLGLLWYDYLELPENWLQHDATIEAGKQLLEYLRSDFPDSSLFVVKDPRLCRLLPFWLKVLEEFGAEPYIVFCHRSAGEVAASLHKRDGIPWDLSLNLWMASYIEAEESSRGRKRFFVAYQDLLDDWRKVASHISNQFDIPWPRPIESVAAEVESFLSPGHRHHNDVDLEHLNNPRLDALIDRLGGALHAAPGSRGSAIAAVAPDVRDYLRGEEKIFGELIRFERIKQFEYRREKWAQQRRARKLSAALAELRERYRWRKRKYLVFLGLTSLAALVAGLSIGYFLAR